jgi:hypothetical protein
MAITNGYSTLVTVKARLKITDTADDSALEAIITAVSRAIDDYCGRRFYAANETRYYTATRPDGLMVDDILSVSALLTDDDGDRTYENTWATTDYDLTPDNAALKAEPYWKIITTPAGTHSFPANVRKGVKVTGSFGYASATPAVIEEACILQAGRLWRRQDAPFGVVGSAEYGVARISSLDPDVKMLLGPYRLVSVA